MKSKFPHVTFFASLLFLTSCSTVVSETSEEQWKRLYDSGTAARESGDFKTAEKDFRKSIKVLGESGSSEKRARSMLALAYTLFDDKIYENAYRRASDAMQFYKKKFESKKNKSSLDDTGPQLLNSMLLAAKSLNAMHRFKESLPLLERIRFLQQSVIVPVHFNHDLTLELRIALSKNGDHASAQSLKDELLFTESSIKTKDLQDVSALAFREALKEGKSAREGGNFPAAEILLQHAVEVAKKGGGKPTDLPEAMLNLGDVYSAQKKYAQAQPLLEKSLELARKNMQKNDHHLKEYLNRLASFYANNKQWKKAAQLNEEALDLSYGEELKRDSRVHRSRDIMDALIEIYCKDGQFEKAEKMALRKLKTEEESYGKESRKVGITECQLAKVLALKKQPVEAEKYFELSLQTLKNSKNCEPREFQRCASAYCEFLESRGDKLRAEKLKAEAKAVNDEIVDGLAGKEDR